MKLKAAQFSTLMLFALVTGVFWGTWFSLSRSMAQISPGTFLEIGGIFIRNLAMPMRFLMPGAILASLLTLFLLPRKRSPAFHWTLAGSLLMIAALAITLSVNVPIDNQIKTWTLDSLPGDWARIRDRWESFHTLRTWVSITSLAAMILGTLSDRN
jgi:uncharacterized membrane protein